MSEIEKNQKDEKIEEKIIKISDLKKSYFSEENEESQILRGISTEVKKRDFAILYGPSGSGKSTLLHHIVGLEQPTSGNVIVNGTDITKLNQEERAIFRAKTFGMVYQFWYWAKSLTVWENVAMPLFISGSSEARAKRKAMESLAGIGIEKYAYKRPTQLSGGEQQRVGLARALVNNPPIIVADEPTGNLDTHNADLVMQIFQDLNHIKHRTVIMVTHNLSYLPMANRTIGMRDGLVVSSNTEAIKEQIKKELKGVL